MLLVYTGAIITFICECYSSSTVLSSCILYLKLCETVQLVVILATQIISGCNYSCNYLCL